MFTAGYRVPEKSSMMLSARHLGDYMLSVSYVLYL